MEDAVKEFYSTLPHRMECANSIEPSTAWLSRKQDLCQVSFFDKVGGWGVRGGGAQEGGGRERER